MELGDLMIPPPGGEVGGLLDACLCVFVQTTQAQEGGGTSLRFSCSLSPGGGGCVEIRGAEQFAYVLDNPSSGLATISTIG